MHLSLQDVAVDSELLPKIISISIKHSKADQMQQGQNSYQEKTLSSESNDICLVATHMLSVSMKIIWLNAWSLSSAVKAVLGKLQLDHNEFYTHSLQIVQLHVNGNYYD